MRWGQPEENKQHWWRRWQKPHSLCMFLFIKKLRQILCKFMNTWKQFCFTCKITELEEKAKAAWRSPQKEKTAQQCCTLGNLIFGPLFTEEHNKSGMRLNFQKLCWQNIVPLPQHTRPLQDKLTSVRIVLCRHIYKWSYRTIFILTPWNKYLLLISTSEYLHLSWVILQLKKAANSFLLFSKVHLYCNQEQTILERSLGCCGLLLSL